MTSDGSAHGKIIILDTAKKFIDLMDKSAGTKALQAIRQLVTAGGTAIMLAHVNKSRGADGKLIHAGTSDMLDDIDCAYLMDAMGGGPIDNRKVVTFDN